MKQRKGKRDSKSSATVLRRYTAAARSESTRVAYTKDIEKFRRWGGRVPSTPNVVARYLAEHAEISASASLGRMLAAINYAHRQKGVTSPTHSELVRATLMGIRRTHRRPQRQAAPLLQRDLRRRVAHSAGLRGVRDRSLLLVGFAGGFRASEIVGLNVEDVEFVKNGVLIRLRKSKTDQEGKGRLIAIPHGKGAAWSCPVRTVRSWLRRAGLQSGALYRKVDRNGVVCGERLSTQVVALVVKELVKKLGKDPSHYSGHSLRAGFVTSAAAAGMPTWRIRQQTGHQSEQMLMRYIRPMDLFTDHVLLSVL